MWIFELCAHVTKIIFIKCGSLSVWNAIFSIISYKIFLRTGINQIPALLSLRMNYISINCSKPFKRLTNITHITRNVPGTFSERSLKTKITFGLQLRERSGNVVPTFKCPHRCWSNVPRTFLLRCINVARTLWQR